MERQVNVAEAKTHLSRLLDLVAAGDHVVIARAGRPVAVLGPYRRPTGPRQLGGWRGRVHVADDFDELPDDLLAAFHGEDP
ncbi:MAG: type II toxin-antitoxin system prevent-host-death family antitoxin [Actinomycetota bacterium]|nr:type II toxin-antitoxin system prevent-host-death family antitoxin [Actinomycetota bacterium]